MNNLGVWFRILLVLSYLLVTGIISRLGPKVGDPKHVVDPSSVFTFINWIFVSQGFLISFVAVALLRVTNRLVCAQPMMSREKLVEGILAIAATSYWVIWRLFFFWLDHRSGSCRIKQSIDRILHNRTSCVSAGGYWDGFDISGHCFLVALTCSFFYDAVMEAITLIRNRRKGLGRGSPTLEARQSPAVAQSHLWLLEFVQYIAIFCVLAVWLAWTALLLHTSLYFHTIWEKILGLAIGFLFWPLVHTINLFK